jgi:tripartite-type tricarboxylate transporter receptor subunit TctC
MTGPTSGMRGRTIGIVAAGLMLTAACGGGSDSDSAASTGGSTADNCDGFPDRNITMVIGRTAGGGHDEYGRFLVPLLEEELGQTVVIENRDGAGGRVAVNQVQKAKPDGYTIHLLEPNGLAALQSVQEVDYDLTALTALGAVNSRAATFAVKADSPYKTFEELVAASKQEPLTFATAGLGSPNFVNGIVAADAAGMQVKPVPHEGSAEAITSVIRGDTDYTVFSGDAIAEHVDSGELRALVQFSEEPYEGLSDVPTGEGVGLGQLDGVLTSNLVMVAPPELPACVQETLTDAVQSAVNSPEFAKFGEEGRIVSPGTAEDAEELIAKAIATYEEYSDVFGEYIKS